MRLHTFPLALGIAAGCSPRDSRAGASSAVSDAPTAFVIATDYAFDAPATIPAGRTTFRLINRGKELHQLILAKMPAAKTLDDLERDSKGGAPPAWVELVGGPNAVDPSSQTEATQMVEPGLYALLCVIRSADGKPHIMKGMAGIMEVTGPVAAAPKQRPAELTMKLADYGFTTSKALSAGVHEIEVENNGPQPHEVVLVQLAPGKSLPDFLNWAMQPAGPPPGRAIGGISPMAPGRSARMKVDLSPGDYALICFVSDAEDGKPHFVHGMAQQIHVD